jgi:hypothetical protein
MLCRLGNANGCGGNQSWLQQFGFPGSRNVVTDLPTARPKSVMKLRPVTYHWKDKSLDRRLKHFAQSLCVFRFRKTNGVQMNDQHPCHVQKVFAWTNNFFCRRRWNLP